MSSAHRQIDCLARLANFTKLFLENLRTKNLDEKLISKKIYWSESSSTLHNSEDMIFLEVPKKLEKLDKNTSFPNIKILLTYQQ